MTQLERSLETTPDDRLQWSPSPTARTPLQLVANGALSMPGMQDWLDGKPWPYESVEHMDAENRKAEAAVTTREAALAMLRQNADGYRAWLDGIDDARMGSVFASEMGEYPFEVAVGWSAGFLRNRAAQLDYVQTCYGDLSFHLD